MKRRKTGRRQRRFRISPRIWAPVAATALLLTACGGGSTVTASPPAVRSAPQVPYTDSISFFVETQVQTGEAADESGTVLASYTYQLPVMTALRKDGTAVSPENAKIEREKQALATAKAFNEEFQRWAEEADFASLAEAAGQGARRPGGQVPYAQDLECEIYQTDRLVSVAGQFYVSSGGAHPNTGLYGWNFDLASGRFFSVGELFDDVDAVTRELVRKSTQRAAKDGLSPEQFFWKDYAEILAAWSESAVAVTFDGENMTVSYSPYDLAAYAAGPQIFTIPLEWLEPYLSAYGKSLLA